MSTCENCKKMINEFIYEKLENNIDMLSAFNFDSLENDEKYGKSTNIKGTFDPDDTEILRAIYCILWRDTLTICDDMCLRKDFCGTGKLYRGDTMLPYKTVCDETKWVVENRFPNCTRSKHIIEIDKFKSTHYYLGNFMPLCNIPLYDVYDNDDNIFDKVLLGRGKFNGKRPTLNKYKGNENLFGDFFDVFLAYIKNAYEEEWNKKWDEWKKVKYKEKWNEQWCEIIPDSVFSQYFVLNYEMYFAKFVNFPGFVEKNFLKEYIDINNDVKDLFVAKEHRQKGCFKKYYKERVSDTDISNYLEYATDIINIRGETMVNELRERLVK